MFIEPESMEFVKLMPSLFIKPRTYELLPDILHRRVGRVYEVRIVESVVAQFVHHQFISRKIRCIRIGMHQLVNSEQEDSLAQGVGVKSIADMAYRADSEEPSLMWIVSEDRCPCVQYFFRREPTSGEGISRQFMAISYYVSVAFVDPRGAKGDDDEVCLCKRHAKGRYSISAGFDEVLT